MYFELRLLCIILNSVLLGLCRFSDLITRRSSVQIRSPRPKLPAQGICSELFCWSNQHPTNILPTKNLVGIRKVPKNRLSACAMPQPAYSCLRYAAGLVTLGRNLCLRSGVSKTPSCLRCAAVDYLSYLPIYLNIS